MQSLRLAALTQLHSLSFDELLGLAACAEEQWVPAGQRLLLDGGLHDALALIAAGRGVVRCAGEPAGVLGPGDGFGALSTRGGRYVTAKLCAIEDLHLVVFGSHAIGRLRATAPDTVDALLAVCAVAPSERAVALVGARPTPELQLVATAA